MVYVNHDASASGTPITTNTDENFPCTEFRISLERNAVSKP